MYVMCMPCVICMRHMPAANILQNLRLPAPRRSRRCSGMRRATAAFACLATVTALTAMPALTPVSRAPLGHLQRSQTLFAQVAAGWTTRADPNGDTYYYNEQTGQSQWDPPQAEAGAPVLWRIMPAAGVITEYAVRRGEQQVLGCNDLAEQKGTIPDAQCVVQVAADGTATLVSLGSRCTGLRARYGAPSYGLRKDGPPHALADGEEIILDVGHPESSVFTCQAERGTDSGMGGYPQQGGAQLAGWTTRVDESTGSAYYYNEQTGQSQWEAP
jgi:hypothetical protein